MFSLLSNAQIPKRNASDLKAAHHVRSSSPAGECNSSIRLALVYHLLIADMSCTPSVRFPIGGECVDGYPLASGPLRAKPVCAARSAFDKLVNPVLSVYGRKNGRDLGGVGIIPPACYDNSLPHAKETSK